MSSIICGYITRDDVTKAPSLSCHRTQRIIRIYDDQWSCSLHSSALVLIIFFIIDERRMNVVHDTNADVKLLCKRATLHKFKIECGRIHGYLCPVIRQKPEYYS